MLNGDETMQLEGDQSFEKFRQDNQMLGAPEGASKVVIGAQIEKDMAEIQRIS